MRKVYVLERDLLFALTNQMKETAHYLDLKTGDVIPVFSFNRDEILARVRANPEQYVRLVPQTRGQGIEMINRFIETVSRADLKAKLKAAVKEGRIFSRFRSVLETEPEELRRWQQFRVMVLTESLKQKLQKMNLELVLIGDDAAGTTCVPIPEDEPDEE